MPSLISNLDQLRLYREHNERKSVETIDLWEENLSENVHKFGKEKPVILEQVCIAALDCHHFDIANKCLHELNKEFPNSQRVFKYEAMLAEAQGDYEKALKILDKLIAFDETNSGAKKRKIAILKAQGRTADAIRELTEYLKVFMADVEAWQEVGELYIAENDFQKAAFCVEELLLHNPHNHLLHQRYADVRYSQGGLENMELARSYYCQAVKLNPKNLRAFYGIYLTTSAIAASQKCTASKKKDAQKLCDWSLGEIREIYENGGKKIKEVEACLNALQIS